MKLLRSLLVVAVACVPMAAQEGSRPPQIYLMTMGVGEQIEARFGHNAIWVHDTAAHTDLVYNYGTFDYADPHFVAHFVHGRPTYWLAVEDLPRTLATYRHFQRGIVVQELNLTPAQQLDIAQRLAVNARPENREYPYDYYLDNCATRVRDLLDTELGGALKRATLGKPAAGTLRFHTQRSITNDLFMYIGIMILMGPSTDRPLDQWGEMFLPEKIQERVREIRVPGPNGSEVPLVKNERTLLDVNVFKADDAPPAWGLRFLAVGTALGLLILTGMMAGGAGAFGRGLGRGWLLLCGVAGLLLAYVMFFTNHVAAANNRNLLLLSPLALPLLFQIRAAPSRAQGRTIRFVWFAFAGSIGVGTLFALIPALGVQWNVQLAALVVPPSVAALAVSYRRRRDAGDRGR